MEEDSMQDRGMEERQASNRADAQDQDDVQGYFAAQGPIRLALLRVIYEERDKAWFREKGLVYP